MKQTLFFVVLFLISCEKSKEVFEPYQDLGQVDNLLSEIDNKTEAIIFDAAEDAIIVTENEIVIQIGQNDLVTANGDDFDDDAVVVISEIINSGQLALYGFETKVKGVSFYGNATLGIKIRDEMGNALYVKEGEKIDIYHNNQLAEHNRNVRLFKNGFQGDKQNWVEIVEAEQINQLKSTSWEFNLESGVVFGQGYQYQISELGWYLVGDYYSTENTSSNKLCVQLPELFNNNNTKVFFMLKDKISVVNLHSLEDSYFVFCGHLPKLASNMQAQMVTVSQTENEDIYLGIIEQVEIGNETTLFIIPNKSTKEKVEQFLLN